ncbi:MAG: Lrp/AsnC ligand binding domain-containing protein [Thermoproteota archaeon]
MKRVYIFIETKPAKSIQVVKRIKEEVEEVVQADPIYGQYDAIVIIEAPKLENINEILYKVIEKDPNIIHTETALVLESPFDWRT